MILHAIPSYACIFALDFNHWPSHRINLMEEIEKWSMSFIADVPIVYRITVLSMKTKRSPNESNPVNIVSYVICYPGLDAAH